MPGAGASAESGVENSGLVKGLFTEGEIVAGEVHDAPPHRHFQCTVSGSRRSSERLETVNQEARELASGLRQAGAAIPISIATFRKCVYFLDDCRCLVCISVISQCVMLTPFWKGSCFQALLRP